MVYYAINIMLLHSCLPFDHYFRYKSYLSMFSIQHLLQFYFQNIVSSPLFQILPVLLSCVYYPRDFRLTFVSVLTTFPVPYEGYRVLVALYRGLWYQANVMSLSWDETCPLWMNCRVVHLKDHKYFLEKAH